MVDNLYHLSRADQQLELGGEVEIRWTADGYSYCGRGRITGLRRSSVQVTLQQRVGPNGRYPAGKTLEIPRFSDQTRWSSRNCVQSVMQNSPRL